jgi:cysteine desulfurase/selenocysteine lyase
MDTNRIRNDFPLLQGDDSVVYVDNACATLKPEPVLAAMDAYNRDYPTCGGRSINRLGERVTKAVQHARETTASFISAAHTDEIVFVRNTSEGLNLLAYSIPLSSSDVILTSDKEHNSNLVPWQRAAERTGARHVVVPTNSDGTFNLEWYQEALATEGVTVVAMSMTSNLDGVSIPSTEVTRLAHEHGATVVLDAAQAAPHEPLDVTKLQADFVVFSGHKLCGPSGTGVVYGSREAWQSVHPFMVGGSTVSTTTYEGYELLPVPERFEAGTQDYAGIIGLAAAMEYVTAVGRENITRHEHKLNAYATEQIESMSGVHILGPHDPVERAGILSFYVDGVDMHQIALTLDTAHGVLVRSGQHCVHSWFTAQGIPGSVRWSFYFYNTTDEVDRCVAGLEQIIAVYS